MIGSFVSCMWRCKPTDTGVNHCPVYCLASCLCTVTSCNTVLHFIEPTFPHMHRVKSSKPAENRIDRLMQQQLQKRQLLQQLQQLKKDAEELVQETLHSNGNPGPSNFGPSSNSSSTTAAKPEAPTASNPHSTAAPQQTSSTIPLRSTTNTEPIPHTSVSSIISMSSRSAEIPSSAAVAELKQKDEQERTAWLAECRKRLEVASAWPNNVGTCSGGGSGFGTTAEEKLRLEAAAKAPSRATLQSVYRLQQLQKLQLEGIAMIAQMSS